jgi:Uma2 family endonuclease
MKMLLELEQVTGFDRLPPDALFEVIDGEAREVAPMGAVANIVANELAFHIRRTRRSPRDLVVVETLFTLPAPVDRRRRPDMAYMAAEKVPPTWPPTDKDPPSIPGAPSMAVEVISPTDEAMELEQKRQDYFNAGVEIVLFIYPAARTVHVHESVSKCRILTESDTLEFADILPGFSVVVAELFAPLNHPT